MYEELAIAIRDRINQRCCAETGEPISGASGRLTCNIALTGRATLYAREVLCESCQRTSRKAARVYRGRRRTGVDLHVCHDLPPVHRHDPTVVSSSAAIDDHPSDLVRPCSRVRESLGQLDAPDVDDKALLSDLFGEPS
jgi:hypothetical protein